MPIVQLLRAPLSIFRWQRPGHTADEEKSLFPRLRSASGEQAKLAIEDIGRLEADHERADACHAEANALANRWLAEDRVVGQRFSIPRGS